MLLKTASLQIRLRSLLVLEKQQSLKQMKKKQKKNLPKPKKRRKNHLLDCLTRLLRQRRQLVLEKRLQLSQVKYSQPNPLHNNVLVQCYKNSTALNTNILGKYNYQLINLNNGVTKCLLKY